jgi:hypothetical protein
MRIQIEPHADHNAAPRSLYRGKRDPHKNALHPAYFALAELARAGVGLRLTDAASNKRPK